MGIPLDLVKPDHALAAQNQADYRPDLAQTLNGLGNLYQLTQRVTDAEAAYKEATAIQRDVAAQNPAYRPDLARTLNNLAALYGNTQLFAEAEAAFKEAAKIQRDLAAQNPAAYWPDLSQTLNNWAFSTATHSASPTPRPLSRRPPTSIASWPRRTRPPTCPSWRGRSTTSPLCTGRCTAMARRKAAEAEAQAVANGTNSAPQNGNGNTVINGKP